MEMMIPDSTLTIKPWRTVKVPVGLVWRLVGLGFRPTDADITGDIDRLVRSIIASSTDHSNVNLQFDEMYGELMLKLAQILSRHDLYFANRGKFFGFLKLALTRHKKTLIQRHVFTEKRTGIKRKSRAKEHEEPNVYDPVPRNIYDDDPRKMVKIELDDDEHGVSNYFGVESGREQVDSIESISQLIDTYLTWIEAGVLRQEMEPNDSAYCYALAEHDETGKNGKFKIRDLHKAQGIGMELHAYKKVLNRCRIKLEPFIKGKSMSDTEIHPDRLAELQLCEIFNIQVPSHVDPLVKKRCFTIAARDNYDKVTAEVAELLERVGANIPKKHGDVLGCFGVLVERGHRACTLCSLEEPCAVEATKVGLARPDFQIDKRLLGTKATKTPMILPRIDPPEAGEKPVKVAALMVLSDCDRDEEIMAFLNESMQPTLHEGEIFYKLPDKNQKRLFCVGQPERLMQLRFCNPSDKLKSELVPTGKGPAWIVPSDMSLGDAKTLMNEHIANSLK